MSLAGCPPKRGRGGQRPGDGSKCCIHKPQLAVNNRVAIFHLFSSQSDHVQRAVHEATNQSLRPVLCGNDIIHPVVGSDVLQRRARAQDTVQSWLLFGAYVML